MHRRRLLAALGTIGSAGCLRFADPGSTRTDSRSGRSTTRAATARGTTSRTAPSTPEEEAVQSTATGTAVGTPSYPLGLDDDGPTGFLFSEHVRALIPRSFAASWKKLDTDRTELLRDRTYEAADGTIRGYWLNDRNNEVEIYRSARNAYWRERIGDQPTYGNDVHRNDKRYEWVLWSREIPAVLAAAGWSSPTVTRRDPRTIWTLEADSLATEGVNPQDTKGTIRDIVSAEMQVDEHGVIRALNASYRVEEPDGGTREFQTRYAVDAIGTTQVASPSWLPTAEERSPDVSIEITDDRHYVALTVVSGNRLEAHSVIQVYDRERHGSVIDVILEDPLEAGTTAYLYTESGTTDAALDEIARDGRPADASPEPLPNTYDVWTRRRDLHYFKRYSVD